MSHDIGKSRSRIMSVFKLLFAYCIAFVAGYGLTGLAYSVTGRPPEFFAHLFTGLAAVSLIMLTWRLVVRLNRSDQRAQHQDTHDRLTDALAQMAQGKYDILFDFEALGAFNALAKAINDMARNLGTLEAMRQDFVANVSHEIQSPLTSISGFAALLQKESLTDEQRRRYAAIIEAESKRLSSLSDNLLKLSALDDNKAPLNKKDFRLDKQIERAALMHEPQWAAKNIVLEADLQKCMVHGDETLLLQVWVNLLNNAVKFTPDGGRISVSLTADHNAAVVKISDTGVGIAPEDQIHIFERFFKADKARDRSMGGNGLGLSLVKTIVEMHGGSVTVESEVGHGTTFLVLLHSLHSV